MKPRFLATVEAYDTGIAECVITEVGTGHKLKSFVVQVNVPDAMAVLHSALIDAAYLIRKAEDGDEVRDRYRLRLEAEGDEVKCSSRLTTLGKTGRLDRCEFDDFTVKASGSLEEMMVEALLAAKDRIESSSGD
jgi:hypothetical protein